MNKNLNFNISQKSNEFRKKLPVDKTKMKKELVVINQMYKTIIYEKLKVGYKRFLLSKSLYSRDLWGQSSIIEENFREFLKDIV